MLRRQGGRDVPVSLDLPPEKNPARAKLATSRAQSFDTAGGWRNISPAAARMQMTCGQGWRSCRVMSSGHRRQLGFSPETSLRTSRAPPSTRGGTGAISMPEPIGTWWWSGAAQADISRIRVRLRPAKRSREGPPRANRSSDRFEHRTPRAQRAGPGRKLRRTLRLMGNDILVPAFWAVAIVGIVRKMDQSSHLI